MGEISFQNLLSDNQFVFWGDSMLRFLTRSCLEYSEVEWNRKLMKIFLAKITHENQNWTKKWLSIDSTLWIFSKINSSSWLSFFLNWNQNSFFRMRAYFFYIKQPKYNIDRDLKENRKFWWKIENPWFENVAKVTVLSLALGEDEESQWFP